MEDREQGMDSPGGPDPGQQRVDLAGGRDPYRSSGTDRGSSSLTVIMVAVVGVALGAVIPHPPHTTRDWIIVAAGAFVAAAVSQLDMLQKWLARVVGGLRRPGLKIVATLGLTLLLALAIGFGASRLSDLGQSARVQLAGCPHPTQLRVLTSPDGLDPVRMLAGEYEKWTEERNHGCPSVSVHVYAASAKDTRSALSAGWSTKGYLTVGPRPDLWLADSGSAVGDIDSSSNSGITILDKYRVASSPIVLGMSDSIAAQALADRRQLPTWAELRKEDFLHKSLVRPDPRTSATGEVATALLYGIEQPVDGAEARKIEQRIGRSLDDGGYQLGNSLQLLCRHRQLATSGSASGSIVVVSEQALVRFNKGDPLGGKCATAAPEAVGDHILRAFYPLDTRALDYWFIRFSSYPAQQEDAARFRSWLTGDEGKQALVGAGLRPPSFPVNEPLSEPYGVQPGAKFTNESIGPEVLNSAIQLYDEAYRPGRVLLALDASGSMAAAIGNGETRFEVVAEGAKQALGLMGVRDEFGLRFFPAGESVPIGPLGRADGISRQEATDTALSRTAPNGNTPLFQAIVDSVQEVGQSSDERVSALVVLTDGENTPNGRTLDQVREVVQRAGVRIFIIAVGETRCASEALRTLTADTFGDCHDTDFSSVGSSLEKVFTALWKGR
ncbi:MAG: vWA domain-containing protein [Pseudonocardiaceae bacterium]